MRASARNGSASQTWSMAPRGDVGKQAGLGRQRPDAPPWTCRRWRDRRRRSGRSLKPAHGDWRSRVATVRPSVPAPTIATWRWLRPRRRSARRPERTARRSAVVSGEPAEQPCARPTRASSCRPSWSRTSPRPRAPPATATRTSTAAAPRRSPRRAAARRAGTGKHGRDGERADGEEQEVVVGQRERSEIGAIGDESDDHRRAADRRCETSPRTARRGA